MTERRCIGGAARWVGGRRTFNPRHEGSEVGQSVVRRPSSWQKQRDHFSSGRCRNPSSCYRGDKQQITFLLRFSCGGCESLRERDQSKDIFIDFKCVALYSCTYASVGGYDCILLRARGYVQGTGGTCARHDHGGGQWSTLAHSATDHRHKHEIKPCGPGYLLNAIARGLRAYRGSC